MMNAIHKKWGKEQAKEGIWEDLKNKLKCVIETQLNIKSKLALYKLLLSLLKPLYVKSSSVIKVVVG